MALCGCAGSLQYLDYPTVEEVLPPNLREGAVVEVDFKDAAGHEHTTRGTVTHIERAERRLTIQENAGVVTNIPATSLLKIEPWYGVREQYLSILAGKFGYGYYVTSGDMGDEGVVISTSPYVGAKYRSKSVASAVALECFTVIGKGERRTALASWFGLGANIALVSRYFGGYGAIGFQQVFHGEYRVDQKSKPAHSFGVFRGAVGCALGHWGRWTLRPEVEFGIIPDSVESDGFGVGYRMGIDYRL